MEPSPGREVEKKTARTERATCTFKRNRHHFFCQKNVNHDLHFSTPIPRSTPHLLRFVSHPSQLDLSQNCIETTMGLRCLPALHTLNLSKNALKDADSVAPLSECPSLTNLDVTANTLAGPGVLDVRAVRVVCVLNRCRVST